MMSKRKLWYLVVVFSLLWMSVSNQWVSAEAAAPEIDDQAPSALAQEGVSDADWASMEAQMAAAQYHFTWQQAGDGWAYRAPNPANELAVAVGEAGIAFQNGFHLALTAWGSVSVGTAALSAEKDTVLRQSGGVTETVTNTPEGVTYQATIQQPASGDSTVLAYQLSGGMTAALSGKGLAVYDGAGNLAFRMDDLTAVDAAGNVLSAAFALDGEGLLVTIEGLDRDAYPLAVSLRAHSQSKKLIASDAQAEDYFGIAVAVSGDVIVVSASHEDSGGTDAGAAYVFQRMHGGADNWGEVQKLTASNAEGHASFGQSVAVSGDVIVVGAVSEDSAGSDAGAAYVFQRMQGGVDNWGEVKRLIASDAQAYTSFGHYVGVWGDVIVVGAASEDSNGTNAGAAYVFQRMQGGNDNWGEVQKLVAADPEAGDYFGRSVAVWGDVIVVGAHREESGGSDAGAAYVFQRMQGGLDNWGQVQKLMASDPEASDYFGMDVAVWGDVIVVGAADEDTGGSRAGAAYVYQRMEGGNDNWGLVKKLMASDAQANDQFGFSTAVSGDLIVVGAVSEDSAGTDAGAVYVFHRLLGGEDNWGEMQKLTALDAESNDLFGASVAVSGDVIVVGAYREDSGGTDAGAAYVFHADAENWEEIEKTFASDAEEDDQFGRAVAISGDVIVVGAYNEGAGGLDAGAAYVFQRMEGGNDNWGEVQKLMASDAEVEDLFGNAVAVFGDVIVVGARYEDSPANMAGAAYVFQRMEGGGDNWGEVQKLTASDAEEFDNFGYSVAVWGDVILVGTGYEDTNGNNAGAAYVFQRMEGGQDNWGEVKKLLASDGEAYDHFGYSVDVCGDVIVVGAYYEETGGSHAGAAYVYQRMQGGVDNWGEVKKLMASDAAADRYFGRSVAVWGDVIAVVSSGVDVSTFVHGGVYVFERMAGGNDNWGEVQIITPSNADDGSAFGRSLDIWGNTILVGATVSKHYPTPGAAFVFQRNVGGVENWGQVQKLTVNGAQLDNVGYSVGISGDAIVIGAPGDDSAADLAGAAYIFQTDLLEADLSISKAASPDPVNVNSTLTYTLSVENLGGDAAADVAVTDTLPAGVTYQSASGDGWSCSESSGTVTCTRASLAVGVAPDITITVTAPGTSGDITNTASVSASTYDPDLSNNDDSALVTVNPSADLTISKAVSPDPVNVNSTLTYTLSVENLGGDAAADVVVTDTLPAGVTYQSASGDGWSCSESSGTVTCTRASLAVGAAPDITITVTAPSTSGDITNNAAVSATTDDPDLSNNADSAVVLVELFGLYLPIILK